MCGRKYTPRGFRFRPRICEACRQPAMIGFSEFNTVSWGGVYLHILCIYIYTHTLKRKPDTGSISVVETHGERFSRFRYFRCPLKYVHIKRIPSAYHVCVRWFGEVGQCVGLMKKHPPEMVVRSTRVGRRVIILRTNFKWI